MKFNILTFSEVTNALNKVDNGRSYDVRKRPHEAGGQSGALRNI